MSPCRPPRRSFTHLVVIVIVAATAMALGPGLSARAASESYHAVTPQRLLDTRIAFGTSSTAMTTPGVPTPISLPAAASGVAAVVLNLTVTEPAGDGFATAYPCGQQLPLASNVNFLAAQTVPNLVIAKPGTDGHVCVVTSVAAHLVVDLQGWFPIGAYDPLPVPERVLDTRTGAQRKLAAGVETFLVADQSSDAIVANVTVIDPDTPGYLTVYPCGTTPPITSNLNFVAGEVVANLAIARSGGAGVCAVAERVDRHRGRRTGAHPGRRRIHGDLAGPDDRYTLADRSADRGPVAAWADRRTVVSGGERHPSGRRHRGGQRHRDRLARERLPHRVSV